MGKIKNGACALCAALIAAFTFSGSLSARADDQSITDKQQQLNSIREENERRQQEIDALGGDISDNEQAMSLVSDQIDGYLAEIAVYGELVTAKQSAVEQKKTEISEIEKSIAENETEIETKKIKAAELEAQNKANLENFGKLIRYMYMNNVSSQAPILNGSNDWYEYFVYSDVVSNITRQNADFMDEITSSIEKQQNMITELNSEIAAMETEKDSLETEKAELEQQEAELESTKAALESDANDKRIKLQELAAENDDFKARISGLKSSIAEAEAQMEAINAEIEELIRQAQANRDPEMPDYSGEGLRWPLDPEHHRITTYFGFDPWRGGNHSGIDICDGNIVGAPIYSAQSGTVVTISNTCTHNEGKNGWTCGCGGNYGNYVIIDHGGALATLYGHMQAIYVSEGEFVEKGQVIGEVGSTGWSTWWHLHFETRVNGARVDPLGYVS